MANPFFGNRVSPNQTTQPSEPVNDAHKKYSRGYSTFDLSVPHYLSARYAELTPHEVFECVEGDNISISNSHNIRSDAFVGPFMNDVTMRKSYFAVDYRAFLPNGWKYIYPLSIDGDDIPTPEVNSVIMDFHDKLSLMYRWWLRLISYSSVNYPISDHPLLVGLFFKFIFFFECFFSKGSLLRYLRSNFYKSFSHDFDVLVDTLANNLVQSDSPWGIMLRYSYDQTTYLYFATNVPEMRPASYILVSLRELFDIIREHPDCDIEFMGPTNMMLKVKEVFSDTSVLSYAWQKNIPFNFSRVCAYQLSCAQFFTNDKIDFVQSSHEYIDNMSSIVRDYVSVVAPLDNPFDYNSFYTYDINGILVNYDWLSGHFLSKMLDLSNNYLETYISYDDRDNLTSFPVISDGLFYGWEHLYNYVMNLFTFRRNLRYGDYFTGARAQPLAVGDVNTPVVGNNVSTLDTTRNLLIQRFRNAVNRVGDRLQDYIEGVLGGISAPDVTIPRFLATITSKFNGYEVENTADEQGRIVTVVNSSDGNYVYQIDCGEPCIVIGITGFQSQRIYSAASDRFFFHKDRYDFFNPFYQYAGDQNIYSVERNARLSLSPFAYTLRHMEYKQRLPMAVGAFIENLPGYAFITDNSQGDGVNQDNVGNDIRLHISPDYIRSLNSEFDRFYPSLTGYSLASYYHFYMQYQNNLICHRKMEYSPSIL